MPSIIITPLRLKWGDYDFSSWGCLLFASVSLIIGLF